MLSVTLFLVAINDITTVIPNNMKCSLYADEFAITETSYIPSVERLQQAINNVYKWGRDHGFKVTVQAAMQFHRRRGLQQELALTINNNRILFVNEHKFLGLIFDQRLKWHAHIKYLKTACTKTMAILKVLSHSKWGADRISMLRLYRALIRSKLDYGCQIYSSANARQLSKRDTVHNEALRISTRAFRSSPINSLYVEASEPSLSGRRDRLIMQYFLRTKQRLNSAIFNLLHNPQVIDPYNRNNTLTAPFNIRAIRLVESLHLSALTGTPYTWALIPVWKIPEQSCCDGIMNIEKDEVSNAQLKLLFLEHGEEHSDAIPIYTDGSKSNERTVC